MGNMPAFDPSLIQYFGGYGKAFGALGNSMSQIGKAKLDLEQQDRDNKKNQAYLDLQKSYYNDAKTAKQEAKQEKFDSNVAANSYLYGAMGKEVPGELTNERAQLGVLDPSIVADAMKTNGKEYKGNYDGVDGNKYVLWSDGTSSAVNGTKPFIDKAFTIDTQYVGGKPTKVGTSLLSGTQNSAYLPGITDDEFNARLSSGLSLGNTLTAQKNAKELGLQYDPLIQDAKDTKTAENTLSTLSSGGFTQQIDPGMIQFYQAKLPPGYQLNVKAAKVNGVDVYVMNPNKMWIKPASR